MLLFDKYKSGECHLDRVMNYHNYRSLGTHHNNCHCRMEVTHNMVCHNRQKEKGILVAVVFLRVDLDTVVVVAVVVDTVRIDIVVVDVEMPLKTSTMVVDS